MTTTELLLVTLVFAIIFILSTKELITKWIDRLEQKDQAEHKTKMIEYLNMIDITEAAYELAEVDLEDYKISNYDPNNLLDREHLDDYLHNKIDYYTRILTNLKFKDE